MKAFKKFLYMVTAVAAFLATGCTEQIEPEPAPELVGQQVYFENNQKTSWLIGRSDDIKTEGGKSYVEIPVYRLNDADAYTVEYRFEAESGIETPAAPKFAAGEKATKFVVYFDESVFSYGVTKTFSIQLSQNLSEYGDSEFTFSITMPEPWVEMGKGIYVDDFLSALLETPAGLMAEVKFEKHAENPNRIRVVEPFGADTMFQLIGGVPGYFIYGEEPSYLEFDITNPDNVLLSANPVPIGFQINFSDVGALDALLYMSDNNEDGIYDAPITFKDGVIRFPANDQVILGYIVNGELGGWYANPTGSMAYALPGVELADYSINVTYAGMRVPSDNSATYAIFDFELGADVEKYRFAIVPENVSADYAAVVEGIVDGTLEGVVELDSSELQYEVALETGTYTIVAVPYAGGEASIGDASATFFYFPGSNGGAEVPDVEINLAIDSLANIMQKPDYEAQYPGNQYVAIGLFFDPTLISGMRIFIGDVEEIHAAVEAEEVTYKQLVDEYGNDVTSWVRDYDNGNVRILQMDPGSNLCIIFAFDTIYGKTQYYHYDYQMPA